MDCIICSASGFTRGGVPIGYASVNCEAKYRTRFGKSGEEQGGAGQRVSARRVAARRVDGVAAGCVATDDSTVGGVAVGSVAVGGKTANGSAVVNIARNGRMRGGKGLHGGR